MKRFILCLVQLSMVLIIVAQTDRMNMDTTIGHAADFGAWDQYTSMRSWAFTFDNNDNDPVGSGFTWWKNGGESTNHLLMRLTEDSRLALYHNNPNTKPFMCFYDPSGIPTIVLRNSAGHSNIIASGSLALYANGYSAGSTPNLLINKSTGYVGIRTATPTTALHVTGAATIEGSHQTLIMSETRHFGNHSVFVGTDTEGSLVLGGGARSACVMLDGDQNTFIGYDSISQISAVREDLKLAYDLFVRTGILTEDIAIAPQNAWSDFVFEDDYELMPLNELESHIVEHNTLPGIPDQEKIASDGYDMHKMNVCFLQKIEELSLYTIEQEKKITVLTKELEGYRDLEVKLNNLIKVVESQK